MVSTTKPQSHWADVTWALQSIISQVIWLFVQKIIHTNKKEPLTDYWLLVLGLSRQSETENHLKNGITVTS